MEIAGSLRLGLPADLARDTASALSLFKRAHPRVHLEVSVERNQLLIEKIRRGELDVAVAITAHPPVDRRTHGAAAGGMDRPGASVLAGE